MKVDCPVLNRKIEDYDCIEFATIAEELMKPNKGHNEFTQKKNFKENEEKDSVRRKRRMLKKGSR